VNRLDRAYLMWSIVLAQRAREKGNHPFGALLVGALGDVLIEAENTVVTARDCTGHAELNLMRLATARYEPDFLAQCTLYSSAEPCPMCAGAIFWGNVRRVVFGLSQAELYALIEDDGGESLLLPCRDVFQHGGKLIEVSGPHLETEARGVHVGFWG
jgi:tRNA(Arg) A34 adenosine deaminase TadA